MKLSSERGVFAEFNVSEKVASSVLPDVKPCAPPVHEPFAVALKQASRDPTLSGKTSFVPVNEYIPDPESEDIAAPTTSNPNDRRRESTEDILKAVPKRVCLVIRTYGIKCEDLLG